MWERGGEGVGVGEGEGREGRSVRDQLCMSRLLNHDTHMYSHMHHTCTCISV